MTAKILMARGVFKWFAVRRKLIKLKNTWRGRVAAINREMSSIPKGTVKHARLVGELQAIDKCRAEVRSLCHSQRWAHSDIDDTAMSILNNTEV